MRGAVLSRIVTVRDLAKSLAGHVARLIDRERAIASERELPRPAFAVAILEEERLLTRWPDANGEPAKLGIPPEHVGVAGREPVYQALRQTRLPFGGFRHAGTSQGPHRDQFGSNRSQPGQTSLALV